MWKMIWGDKKERLLLVIGVMSFIALIVSEIRLPVFYILSNFTLSKYLISDGLKNIISSISSGLFSAYILYFFINLKPRLNTEKKILILLNSIIATVLDAYNRTRRFGHETAIAHVDKSCLEKEWINENINILQSDKAEFISLNFAMQTAHSRIEDFRHALSLAIILSPDHAFQWLIIIDKVRLMAENYKDYLVSNYSIGSEQERVFKSDLSLRLLEILEETKKWINLS